MRAFSSTTVHHSPGERLGLLGDHRGAVMVIAVFMAAFLVGSLWYIIGIGDAVLYRERMQDGADAVAFAAAVYHARGMNIIAMINILMAGILGVLVAFKLLQLINAIALAVSCALAAINVGNPVTGAVCGLTTALESPIESSVEAAEQLVDATLPVLSKTQVAVAVAMPWVAEARAVEVARSHYQEPVEDGGMLSVSLIPNVPQERLGLPVQEDDYAFLCEKAAEGVFRLVFRPFGAFAGWVAGVGGSVVGSFPSYFCGSGSIDSSSVSNTTNSAIKAECEDQAKSLPQKDRDDFIKQCKNDAQKSAGQTIDGSNLNTGGLSDTSNKTSKKVFWDAQNGDGYFQIWAVVMGDDEWPKKAEKGVEIAAWNKRMPMPDVAWGALHLAQAEFYYDESGSWDSMKEDAMWNMRWRARLRRVRPPEAELGSLVSSLLSVVSGKVGPGLASLLGNAEVGAYITGASPPADFEDPFQALMQGGSPWAGSTLEDPMLRNDYGVAIIH